MPKKAKTTESVVANTVTPSETPEITVQVEPVSVKTTTTKEKKVTKAKKAKDSTTVTNDVTTSNTDVQQGVVVKTAEDDDVSVGSTSGNELTDSFHEFVAKLQAVCSSMVTLKQEFKQLEKKFNRELKSAQKQASKKKRKTGNRQPSGFVKPTLISTELASFLGKPTGTEMARTQVTREINAYIRANGLQDKENGRKINADSALTKLLKLGKEDQLTYFNLQRYMSPHFAKMGVTTVEPTTVS